MMRNEDHSIGRLPAASASRRHPAVPLRLHPHRKGSRMSPPADRFPRKSPARPVDGGGR
ncbi:hypothetical protein [Streptomyces sp. NPDC002490]|uniref:hypothetical protein n=1 Tax=Streptomyces sp. NPDC002490 TaxID=3154416 RepID=UPI00332B90BA